MTAAAASKSLNVRCVVSGYDYGSIVHLWAQLGGKPGIGHHLLSMTTLLLYNYDEDHCLYLILVCLVKKSVSIFLLF